MKEKVIEPKADESLTDEEIMETTGAPVVLSGHRRLIAKTASILNAECQKKIEGIFKEIERYFMKLKRDTATGEDTFLVTSTIELRAWWKSLREKITTNNMGVVGKVEELKGMKKWFAKHSFTSDEMPVDTPYVLVKLDDIERLLNITDLEWQALKEGMK